MLKKLIFLATAGSLLMFSSCRKHHKSDQIEPTSKLDSTEEIHVCVDKTLLSNQRLDAADILANKWTTGQTIKIKFLNGDAFLQGKVKQFAPNWLTYANLKFQFVASTETADIKIGFNNVNDKGSWSYVGTDCHFIDQNSPSMYFGWFTSSTPDSEFQRVIVHEFGHALGLIHEHQSPAANIPWDKAKVYAYYEGPPNKWTPTQVDNNIFYKYSVTQTNYSSFDPQSIMLYTISSALTTNGYSTSTNYNLSATDMQFIEQEYPYEASRVLYRYYISNAHFYTYSFNELGYNGFEQVMGRLYSYQKTGTSALYRYYNVNNGDRLTTLWLNELGYGGQNGWVYEGITGYAYTTNVAGTIPVYRYRYYNGSVNDHFFSTEFVSLGSGYTYEGIGFYIVAL